MNKIILILVSISFIILNSCSTCRKHVSKSNDADKTKTSELLLDDILINNNGYLKIKMNKLITGHLFFNTTLNGVKGKFILDTGAGATVVEVKNKDKFKLKVDDGASQTGAGAGGAMSLQLSKHNHLKIDELDVKDFNVYLMDLDHVNKALSLMGIALMDGVIGADLLTTRQGIIDYPNMLLYLKK